MKKSLYAVRLLLAVPLLLGACSEDDADPDPCAMRNISLTASITDAHEGEDDGSITASASGSQGFTFSIDGSNFQSSPSFDGLAAGTYTVTARDQDNCSASEEFTVDELSGTQVSYSAQIKPIIENACWGCHREAGQAGFPQADLSTDEKIKENAARINNAVQEGRMPKGGSLNVDQKAAIAAWVAEGAPINN